MVRLPLQKRHLESEAEVSVWPKSKLIALILALGCAAPPLAWAQTSQPSLKELSYRSAETFSQKGGSPLPLDKAYNQLSDEERAILRSWYRDLADTDEPPYPKDGLAKLYELAMVTRRNIHGEANLIFIVIHVSADGHAHSVSMTETLTEKVKKWLSMIFMVVEYKPGYCSGKPCAMDFPIALDTYNEP